jgi:hypothetical protein
MQIGVEQIKKLRGKSWREIQTRSKQEFAKWNERWLGIGTTEMSDAALYRAISPLYANGTGEGSSALILERLRTSLHRIGNPNPLLPAFAHRDSIVAIMRSRFQEASRAIINRANRAIEGRFSLLGFDDLYFGNPIDWHLEPISGKRTGLTHWSHIDYLNPDVAGDKKVTWELNRHSHFITLGQAYWLTNEEKYASAFISQATSWMDANPPNQGINWASSLELAFRSISWLWALHLFANSPQLTPRFMARIVKFLIAQGRHIESYLSHYFSPNTHLTGEALGLLYLGVALPELQRASVWQNLGLQILLEQLPIHIRRDGIYFEQATYYHRYTVDFYLHLLIVAEMQGWVLPAEAEDRIARALDYLMWMTRPDGSSPLIGDDDGGRLVHLNKREPDDFRDSLAIGAAMLSRGDWKYVAGDETVEMLWLCGPELLRRYDMLDVKAPTANSNPFVDSGSFIMRDGWGPDSSGVQIDCGLHGVYSCGHSHADALAFVYAAKGTTWLIDSGTFTYTGDASARNQFRETAAHNTATVDGLSQSAPDGAFSWKETATSTPHEFITEKSFDYFSGSHNGYKRLADPVLHKRSILFVKQNGNREPLEYLMVRDNFEALRHHNYRLYYHLTSSCRAVVSDKQIRVSNVDGNRLIICAFNENNTEVRIERGWVSRVYGKRETAPVGIIEISGEGDQEVMSFILPFTAKQHGTHVERQPTSVANTGAFTVTGKDLYDIVIAGNGIASVQCQKLRAIASMAWARFLKGKLARLCLVQGKEIEVSEGITLRSAEKVRHCVIQTQDDHLEITIEGTTRFDLVTAEPWQQIVIGKSSFQLEPKQHQVTFVQEGSEWRMENSKK